MKTRLRTILAVTFLMTYLTSCIDQDQKINPAYTLKRNPGRKNVDTLKSIQLVFDKLNQKNKALRDIAKSHQSYVGSAHACDNCLTSDLTPTPIMVNVKDSIAKLFDPDIQPCPIPEKVLKKLRKFKSQNQSWVPKELVSQLNGMPDQALYFKGSGLTVLLHTIKVKHANNTVDNLIIVGSPTFSNINLSDYVSRAINNFGYTLDCSGMMSASIEGTATVPGSDITSKASAAIDKKTSVFIGGGVVVSPLYAAYVGASSGITLPNDVRAQILSSVVNTFGVNDNDSVEIIMSYEVIWSSSKGEQGFNGSADMSARGGIGIGVAQVSGSANLASTVSRSSSFASFDTFLTGRQRLNAPINTSIASIKTLIQQLNQH